MSVAKFILTRSENWTSQTHKTGPPEQDSGQNLYSNVQETGSPDQNTDILLTNARLHLEFKKFCISIQILTRTFSDKTQ